MSRDFSIERLEGLLGRPNTFWRHDVDVSIPAARKMAALQNRMNTSGTYYLMVDSPFYTAEEALEFACFLQPLGHRFGYHVDLRKRQLEDVTKGVFVSAHCPRPEDLWRNDTDRFYAYDAWWEGRYYADSRGRFAYGDPEDDQQDKTRTLQISLHPEWWFDKFWYEKVDGDVYEAFFHEPMHYLWSR